MTTSIEYENALRAAERELKSAVSANDVRGIWRKHYGAVGHRALGRLLVGRSADDQIARRVSRAERE